MLDGSEGHISVPPFLLTTRHGIYNPSERTTHNRIKSTAHMTFASESGIAVREENLMKGSFSQVKFDKLLNNDLKAKVPDALSSLQKALRIRVR